MILSPPQPSLDSTWWCGAVAIAIRTYVRTYGIGSSLLVPKYTWSFRTFCLCKICVNVMKGTYVALVSCHLSVCTLYPCIECFFCLLSSSINADVLYVFFTPVGATRD